MAVKPRDGNYRNAKPARFVKDETNRGTGKKSASKGTPYPVK